MLFTRPVIRLFTNLVLLLTSNIYEGTGIGSTILLDLLVSHKALHYQSIFNRRSSLGGSHEFMGHIQEPDICKREQTIAGYKELYTFINLLYMLVCYKTNLIQRLFKCLPSNHIVILRNHPFLNNLHCSSVQMVKPLNWVCGIDIIRANIGYI